MSPSTAAAAELVARPFLKWAGGKGQLLDRLSAWFPAECGVYHEPFLGGGAVYFRMHATRPATRAVLSDTNPELIGGYLVVRDHREPLVVALGRHERDHSPDHYYAVRAVDPEGLDPVARAARLIYLNRTCFNGLFRVNRQGRFNVPLGRYTHPRILDESGLRAATQALAGADILLAPFESVLDRAAPGDFVYLDPPYQPLSASAHFTAYTCEAFGVEDQERLAAVFRTLDARGCRVMLSNSDHPLVAGLYRGFHLERIAARRAINSRADRRGEIWEVVVLNYAP
ncbi:MAG: DNA adenine methylase [Planctomycetes bacterium]|nr:DNA adenine methylase [Planctomycetota bacterium]